jgi:hypothetical protein
MVNVVIREVCIAIPHVLPAFLTDTLPQGGQQYLDLLNVCFSHLYFMSYCDNLLSQVRSHDWGCLESVAAPPRSDWRQAMSGSSPLLR